MEQRRQQCEAERRERRRERQKEIQARIRRTAAPPAKAVSEPDSLALVALYDSTDGDNWDNNSGWLQAPVAEWRGVTVSGDRVVDLSLDGSSDYSRFGLSGSLPPEMGDLAALQNLNLEYNQLTGEIPPELSQLSSLQVLNLKSNQLTGAIPVSFTNLTSMINSDDDTYTYFVFNDTDLCEPPNSDFQDWLDRIDDVESTGVMCSDEGGSENVSLVGSYDTDGTALGISIANSYAYVADREQGLRIVDVSELRVRLRSVLPSRRMLPEWRWRRTTRMSATGKLACA
jgi:hypothetical protein